MCKLNATITVASRPFLYDFTVTRGSEPVPYRAFLHECCRYPPYRNPAHKPSDDPKDHRTLQMGPSVEGRLLLFDLGYFGSVTAEC